MRQHRSLTGSPGYTVADMKREKLSCSLLLLVAVYLCGSATNPIAKAGYDPREGIKVWEQMQQVQDRRPPDFLSTHPSPKTGISDIESWLPEALAYYEKADRFGEIVVKFGETY
jgi:hypothetical protein